MTKVITLGELLDAGVHFGHQASRWNPKMFPYIYAEQNGIHVIDLVQTARLLTHAYNYARKAAQEKKLFYSLVQKDKLSHHCRRSTKMWSTLYKP